MTTNDTSSLMPASAYRPLINLIRPPTTGPVINFMDKRQLIRDVHTLMLAVAELQDRLVALEAEVTQLRPKRKT